jgi:hypothetical protein
VRLDQQLVDLVACYLVGPQGGEGGGVKQQVVDTAVCYLGNLLCFVLLNIIIPSKLHRL